LSNTQWGWILPEGEVGRGQGTRSFYRTLKEGSLIHDASYWCPLLLAGPLEDVDRSLKGVLGQTGAEAAMKVIQDAYDRPHEVETILHAFDRFPEGVLGPVRVLSMPMHTKMRAPLSTRACLWVHAACAAAAYNALRASINDIGGTGVELEVLDLRRLEVRGNVADAAVCRALFAEKPTREGGNADSLPSILGKLTAGESVNIVLPDPRLAKPIVLGSASASLLLPDAADRAPPEPLHVIDAPPRSSMTEAVISRARQKLRRKIALGEPIEEPISNDTDSGGFGTHFPAVFVRQGQGHPGRSTCT